MLVLPSRHLVRPAAYDDFVKNSNHNNLFSSRRGRVYKKRIGKCKKHKPRTWCELFVTLAVIFLWKRLDSIHLLWEILHLSSFYIPASIQQCSILSECKLDLRVCYNLVFFSLYHIVWIQQSSSVRRDWVR